MFKGNKTDNVMVIFWLLKVTYVALGIYLINGLSSKFNIWPPDLVFEMDDWTLHKWLTVMYVCACMMCTYACNAWVFVCEWGGWVLE